MNMKKLIKNPILTFILGVTLSIGITSVLAYAFSATDVGFNPTDNAWKQNDGSDITNVNEALDDLHLKINSLAFKKVCKYVNNQYSHDPNDHHSVGTMDECEVADGVKKNFYILKTNNKYYRLIMDRNIVSGTMSWESANNYFNIGIKKFPNSRVILLNFVQFNYENKYNLSLAKTYLAKLEKTKNSLLEDYIIHYIKTNIASVNLKINDNNNNNDFGL